MMRKHTTLSSPARTKSRYPGVRQSRPDGHVAMSTSLEVFLGLFPIPRRIADYARMTEHDGWDGLAVTDSQTNNGDAFCALSVAATATQRIQLTTSATNAVTRHPSVVAGAIASVHAESNGRAILGIGRGDSSVRSIGRPLMPLGKFREALEQIQALLRGDPVSFGESQTTHDLGAKGGGVDARSGSTADLTARRNGPGARSGSTADLTARRDGPGARSGSTADLNARSDGPSARSGSTADLNARSNGPSARSGSTRMAWLQSYGLPKVPVSVSATGPKTIEIGAVAADRLTLSLGADLDRLRWAVDLARGTRAAAGLDPLGLSIGAYVNATVHPDPDRARELVRPRLNTYIRHWTMHPNARHTLSADDDSLVERVKQREVAGLTEDFLERHAVAGTSDYVVQRLRSIVALGLDHLIVVGYAGNVDPDALADGSRRFGAEVLPALRATVLTP